MNNEKVCSKCLKCKPLNEFKKNRGKPRSDCKSCNKQYREQNKIAIREQKIAHYEQIKPETQKQKIQRLEIKIAELLALIAILTK